MAIDRWTGKAGNHEWSDAGNWSVGVPATGQDVAFSGGDTFTLDLAGAEPQLGGLTVIGDFLRIAGARIDLDAPTPKHGAPVDLIVDGGGRMSMTNDAIMAATNSLQIGGTVAGTLTAGAVTLDRGAAGWSAGLQILDGTFALLGGSHWGFSNAGTDFTVQVGGPDTSELLVSGGSVLNPQGATTSTIYAGDGATGDGLVLVTGMGSALIIDDIYLGAGYSGTLTVQHGAVVDAGGVFAGEFGDGYLNVTSSGVLAAQYGIVIGGELPVSSALDITNHGSVYAGTNGLTLEEGNLTLDPTATLFGAIASLGGRINATAGPSGHGDVVTLSQAIGLGDWFSDPQFGSVTEVSSSGGAVLDLAGQIDAAYPGSILAVTAGAVELSGHHNDLSQTSLFAGTLILATAGALGSGDLSFLYPYGPVTGTAELLVEKTGSLTATLSGIGNADTIDLAGFGFAAGVTGTFASGTLTLSNGASSTALRFNGSYVSGEFSFTADPHGGTVISFHRP